MLLSLIIFPKLEKIYKSIFPPILICAETFGIFNHLILGLLLTIQFPKLYLQIVSVYEEK